MFHLAFEFLVIGHSHGDGLNAEDGVEASQLALTLLFLCPIVLGHFGHVGDDAIGIALLLLCLLRIVLKDVGHVIGDALGRGQGFFGLNAPHFLVVDVALGFHGADVVDFELQHILVADGIDDGIGMQLFAKGLLRGAQVGKLACTGILGEDRRSREAEDVVFLEGLGNHHVHVAELAAMTFVEDEHHVLRSAFDFLFLFQQGGEFLDGGDDDLFRVFVLVVELALEDVRRGVAVGAAFLEVVVFLHGLVVEVLAVDDEEHLVDIGQGGGYLGGLKRGQGLAAARSMPDVASGARATLPFVHRGLLDAQHDALGGGNLVGTHHEEVLVDREDAVFGQHVEQRGLGKEGLGEVAQVDNGGVFGIGPIAGELKRLRLGLHLRLALVDGSHVGKTRRVAVVFRFGAVADDEHLHIIVEAAACPKRFAFVAVDLVEGFLQRHAATFQFAMHQRQAVDENRHIIAVGLGAAFGHVLVEHLNMVVVDVLLVDELHVLRSAVVAGDVDDFGALDAFGLVLDAHLG